MFCSRCGNEMQDDVQFCAKCGANQTCEQGAKEAATARHVPNYEFRTEKCYPSQLEERMVCNFFQDLGWQILDSERKQIYTGQSSDGTKNYSTSTYIKMQRDKNMPNYDEINRLSILAEANWNAKPKTTSNYIALWIVSFFICMFNIHKPILKVLGIAGALVALCVIVTIVSLKKNKRNREIIDRARANSQEARQKCKRLVDAARQ